MYRDAYVMHMHTGKTVQKNKEIIITKVKKSGIERDQSLLLGY